MERRGLIGAGLLVCLIWGCAPRSGDEGSGLQHDFGVTRREPNFAHVNCKEQASEVLYPSAEGMPPYEFLPEAVPYLQKLANYLMQKNPQTFRDVFDPSKYCFLVVNTAHVNAFALFNSRTIIFNTAQIMSYNNDAEIATTMAHELAHTTMLHGHVQNQQLTADPRWQAEGPNLTARLLEASYAAYGAKTQFYQLSLEYGALDAELEKGSPEEVKKERDALTLESQQLLSEILKAAAAYPMGDEKNRRISSLVGSLRPARPRFYPYFTDAPLKDHQLAPLAGDLMHKVRAYNGRLDALNMKERETLSYAWKSLDDKAHAIVGKLTSWQQNEAISSELTAKLTTLGESIVGDKYHNWVEEEADDVGLEFFLRAGFDPIYFPKMFENYAALSHEEVAACRVQKEAESAMAPARGKDTHPTNCYRIHNATYQELNDHRPEYKPMLEQANIKDIFPGELAALKELLKQKPPKDQNYWDMIYGREPAVPQSP